MSQCTGARKGKIIKTKSYDNRQGKLTHAYDMEFRQDGTVYLIYCNSHPHNPRSTSSEHTHLYDCCGLLCIAAGKEAYSMEVAEALAYNWMLDYSEYLETGIFPNKGRKIFIPDH